MSDASLDSIGMVRNVSLHEQRTTGISCRYWIARGRAVAKWEVPRRDVRRVR